MRRVSGSGGSVYALGEPFAFEDMPLRDCGDGWEWRAPPDLRYWLPGSVSFSWGSARSTIGAVQIHHRSGRVSLERNLTGESVYATGVARPRTLIATGGEWEIIVDAVVADSTALGEDGTEKTKTRVNGYEASILDLPSLPPESVMAWLPTSANGVFVGIGKLIQDQHRTKIHFDQEGVCYAAA